MYVEIACVNSTICVQDEEVRTDNKKCAPEYSSSNTKRARDLAQELHTSVLLPEQLSDGFLPLPVKFWQNKDTQEFVPEQIRHTPFSRCVYTLPHEIVRR